MPFLLETRLRSLGANVGVGPGFKPHVVTHGTLLTGQSPASSALLVEAVNAALMAGLPSGN